MSYEASADHASGKSCPNCQAEVQADAVICVSCGYNFNTGQVMGTQVSPEPEPSSKSSPEQFDDFDPKFSGKKKSPAVAIGIAAALIVLGTLVGIFLFSGGKKKPGPSSSDTAPQTAKPAPPAKKIVAKPAPKPLPKIDYQAEAKKRANEFILSGDQGLCGKVMPVLLDSKLLEAYFKYRKKKGLKPLEISVTKERKINKNTIGDYKGGWVNLYLTAKNPATGKVIAEAKQTATLPTVMQVNRDQSRASLQEKAFQGAEKNVYRKIPELMDKFVLELMDKINTSPDIIMPTIAKGLKHSNPAIRAKSARDLSLIAGKLPGADKGIDMLREMLSDPNWKVRMEVIAALAAYGRKAARFYPEIVSSCDIAEYNINVIENFVAKLGPPSQQQLPILIKLLNSQNKNVRGNAAYAIAVMEKAGKSAGPELAKLYEKGTGLGNVSTVQCIMRIKADDPKSVAVLGKALINDKGHYYQLRKYLDELGPASAPAVPYMMKLLKDDKKAFEMLQLLRQIGLGAKSAAPELQAMLKSKTPRFKNASQNASFRGELMETIQAVSNGSPASLVSTLLVESDNHNARWKVVENLKKACRKNPEIIKELQKVLKDSPPPQTLAAATALIQLGKGGPETYAALRKVTAKSNDPRIVGEAANFLAIPGKGNAATAQNLIRALKTAKADEIRYLVEAIKHPNMKAYYPQTTVALAEALPRADASGQRTIVNGLSLMRPNEKCLPFLIRLLASNDSSIREKTIAVIKKMGPAGSGAIPALVQMLKTGKPYQLPAGVEPINPAGGNESKSRPRRSRYSRSRNGQEKTRIIDVLIRLEPEGIKALAPLMSDSKVRSSVLSAMSRNRYRGMEPLTPELFKILAGKKVYYRQKITVIHALRMIAEQTKTGDWKSIYNQLEAYRDSPNKSVAAAVKTALISIRRKRGIK